MKVAVVFAEPGRAPDERAISNVRRYLPNAEVQWHSDFPSVFDEAHPRWGWRMNDYYKARLMLETDAHVVIAMDADMEIVSGKFAVLPRLAERFGLCLPANPRLLVSVDTEIGADSDKELDESLGTGYALNCSPMALRLNNSRAVEAAVRFCRIMLNNPVRGPLAWWRAFWETSFYPCLLPPQWCVCAENVGIGNEICLHVGHEAVRRHYSVHRPS